MTRPLRFHSTFPLLLVSDVRAALDHYRDGFGFREALVVGDAKPVFGIVDLGEGEGLHLKASGESAGRRNRESAGGDALDVYIRVDRDALEQRFARLAQRGVKLLDRPTDRPWRMREFRAEDRDGFVLCFGGDLTGEWRAGAIRVSAELLVRDLARSLAFYRDALGMQVHGVFGEPAQYAIVGRDDTLLHFAHAPRAGELRSNRVVPRTWDVFFEISGIDAFAAELRARGVALARGVDTTEYWMRELEVRDPDGYALCFGEPVNGWDDR